MFIREFTIAIHFFTPVNDKRREAREGESAIAAVPREGERQINPSITLFFSFLMLAFFIFNFFITYNAERGREVKRQRLSAFSTFNTTTKLNKKVVTLSSYGLAKNHLHPNFISCCYTCVQIADGVALLKGS